MKRFYTSLLFIVLAAVCQAQAKFYDTTAIVVLDRMTTLLGELNSCSFDLEVEKDIIDPETGLATQHQFCEIFMTGPDKLLMNIKGFKGHRGFWYNGSRLYFYSYDENNYAVIDAPPGIIETIDTVNKTYGIDFPAADLFYPTLTDDLIDNSENITFIPSATIGNRDCFQVIANNEEMVVQIWIADDATFLPVKLSIIYNDDAQISRYEATFSDWKLNPSLPPSIFEFTPPPGARKVSILPLKR